MLEFWLPFAGLIVALIGASMSFIRAVRAIAAKKRMRSLLVKRAEYDANFRLLAQRAINEKLTNSETEAVARAIESVAQKQMSLQERRLVESGINQSNNPGRKRYIRDLLSAA
nr:hypothetical protein [uncultured Dongia sp.]